MAIEPVAGGNAPTNSVHDSGGGQPGLLPEGVTKDSIIDYLRAVARDYRKDIAPEFPVTTTPEWMIADWIAANMPEVHERGGEVAASSRGTLEISYANQTNGARASTREAVEESAIQEGPSGGGDSASETGVKIPSPTNPPPCEVCGRPMHRIPNSTIWACHPCLFPDELNAESSGDSPKFCPCKGGCKGMAGEGEVCRELHRGGG